MVRALKKDRMERTTGDGLLAIEETLILCELMDFSRKYVSVFLAEKNVYKTPIFKREGLKNS